MTRYFRLKLAKTMGHAAERLSVCAGNRYCSTPVSQVMCCKHRENMDLDLRWPVCLKHAKPYYFKHMGTPVHFEDIQDADIESAWVEVRPKPKQ